LALLGCGTEPDAFGRCDGSMAVTVSHEAEPEFSWTPADCQMRYGQTVAGTSNSGSMPLHTDFYYTVSGGSTIRECSGVWCTSASCIRSN